MKIVFIKNDMSKLAKSLGVIIAFTIIMQSSGCSIIGHTVGTLIDASQSGNEQIEADDYHKIRLSTNVSIILANKPSIIGEYRGMKSYSANTYSSFFESESTVLNASPLPGDQITVMTDSQEKYEGTFFGYDMGKSQRSYVRHRSNNNTDDPIICQLAKSASGKLTDIYLNQIKSITGNDDRVYKLNDIRQLANSRKLPLRKYLNVWSQGENQELPLQNIENIVIIKDSAPKNSKWILTGIGAVIDIIAIIIIIEVETMFSW